MDDKDDSSNNLKMESKPIPLAYSFNVQTPNQLVDIMTEQGVYLPMDIGFHQMANIRFIILTRRLHQIPFDIVKIDDFWFIEKLFHSDLSNYLKQGDRLLIINKTMISNQLSETDIFKLILHSSVPFIIWVAWDPDTFLKHQLVSRQCASEDAYRDAKTYLLQTSHHEDISLYDHLALIITDAIQSPHRHTNDLFDKLIQNMQYPILKSDLRPAKSNTDLALVKIHAQLLEEKQRDLLQSKDYIIKAVPYLMEIATYCSNAGYGIHITEMTLIWSAMKRLNDLINCTEMKFWGKIFGLYCDYYIVQVQHEEEIPFERIDIMNEKQFPIVKKSAKHRHHRISHQVETKINQPLEIPIEIPSEPHGIGTNQYTYFVTNSPGLPWIKLPDVKLVMIDCARKIRCLFTGCLSSLVNGFPFFPSTEKDYLRAQIARITATTHISPAGFYIVKEVYGGEEEEETTFNDAHKDATITLNSEFNNDPSNPITAEQLADTNLEEWVHSLSEILSQGRTRFWRAPSSGTTSWSREEDEEISNENNIQIPAPLLQPISDDQVLYTDQTPWSIGLTMSIMQEYSMCYVRSNTWPGAFTLGSARNFFNLYVGWGQKYEQFNPSQPPVPESEFRQEFIEKSDPTVDHEKAVAEIQRDITSESASEEYTSEEEEVIEEQLTDEEEN